MQGERNTKGKGQSGRAGHSERLTASAVPTPAGNEGWALRVLWHTEVIGIGEPTKYTRTGAGKVVHPKQAFTGAYQLRYLNCQAKHKL